MTVTEQGLATSRAGIVAVLMATTSLYAAQVHAQTATAQDIGKLPAADNTNATAISGDGTTIVGQALTYQPGGAVTTGIKGVRWTQAGGLTEIGTSGITAVNYDGSIFVNQGASAGPRGAGWSAWA